ncbi:low molecular weight phosphotyrosine protein phosphatase [Rhodobacteraceae bacterium SC52]|nr:low molecular weight phosphotyrosine protein phosphatase [Rhodobacteraceae bacterium SC52]
MTHPTTSPRIVFVCLGNICRSPTAEAVMRALAPSWEIDSAGTGGWHVGAPPHPKAVQAGAARGYDLASLRARKVRASDFRDFDLIVAMDEDNRADLEAIRPSGLSTPVRRLLSYAPETGVRDVPDPYYTGGFDDTLDLVEAGCRGLLRDVSSSA